MTSGATALILDLQEFVVLREDRRCREFHDLALIDIDRYTSPEKTHRAVSHSVGQGASVLLK